MRDGKELRGKKRLRNGPGQEGQGLAQDRSGAEVGLRSPVRHSEPEIFFLMTSLLYLCFGK